MNSGVNVGAAEKVSRSGKPAVVAHRGASGDCPEHTLAAYELALAQGADGLECDVRLTADHELVCVHDRTVDRTSDGSGIVSEMTLAELRELDFGSWHASGGPASILTLRELLTLTLDWRRPVRLFIETKHPVRFGSLVEQKLLEMLHEFGVATPPSADHSRAVVISFSSAGVWRIRRHAPMLPTILLGDTARVLGGGAATAVGATGIGPSVMTLRQYPEIVDRAAAAGRVTYCWTVDELVDVQLCADLGVRWLATNHPAKVRDWLVTVD
ncbi:glycerophosphodiester phosphodiesterase family protein [Gordonia terrae]|uniref:Glycerophosphodiester phosphodiesterase n=2 Tax=Gordonia terrae TaxID=2055 RepID=A0AAD0K6H2_9ACTN|nr:glycerophosphodiester phosphodiesterase family protein [Gordonia terrae]VTR08904.1 glycerophosphoryl diester phosphodiesterase [Clostridioides difficile]ANY21637.1 glycerophosphodiester phosphodiesterase [Gordonia terrae]AWO82365.1 glycerophosphodiester phosphodiesterase [Gordonia terrae]VTS18067.1 Glycerophosphoryl diester phosphodiesterase precursor [Gordonia terrae]GAB44561.1 glycerophosphoryl diester phosphodiesterase [Gordonia terrae NBRC 100016]